MWFLACTGRRSKTYFVWSTKLLLQLWAPWSGDLFAKGITATFNGLFVAQVGA